MSYPIFTLGELTRIRTGKLDANAANENGLYPFFTCAVQSLSINTAAFDCKAVLVAGNGDLNVKYYEGKFNAYQRTYVIECLDESKLYPKYLYLFLDKYVAKLREQSIGGVIKYIKLGNLTDAKIPLPPLAEQKRIAEILDKAAAIKAKREQAIAKLNELAQSTFVEMFSGDKSVVKSLKELGLIKTGGTPPSTKEDMFGDDIPFVTPGDLGSGVKAKRYLTEAGSKESVTVAAGAAMVCCIGATIGKMDIATEKSAFNQQINAIEWNEQINEIYGLYALKSIKHQIISSATTTTLPILKKSLFEKLTIKVPSISEQNNFSEKISSINSCIHNYKKSEYQTDALLASLQHQAFTTGFDA